MLMASLPKTRLIFQMVSTRLLPSFWQNLMQYRCSSSVIFAENNNAVCAAYTQSGAGCTQLTLSAGGKKSTYAHEGTLHLPTKAHLPFFISFRRKKSCRILFEQPSYVDHFFRHPRYCPQGIRTPGQTINGKFYCEVLKWLRVGIRRKCPEKWKETIGFSTMTTHPHTHLSLFDNS
jgi:hypothetical protein